MNMQNLSHILAPAREILATKLAPSNKRQSHVSIYGDNIVEQTTEPGSTRTYYLGLMGKVSQRKKLVGEVVATTRASSTLEAKKFFDSMPEVAR